jgi:3D (Asp-Asp-Asp) domain-containing protein
VSLSNSLDLEVRAMRKIGFGVLTYLLLAACGAMQVPAESVATPQVEKGADSPDAVPTAEEVRGPQYEDSIEPSNVFPPSTAPGQKDPDKVEDPGKTEDPNTKEEPSKTEEPSKETPAEPQKKPPASAAFPLVEPNLAEAERTSLWATYYYLPQVSSVADGFPLLDMKGKPIGPKLSRRDWCNSAMEGSVRVTDEKGVGTTYNYAGVAGSSQVDCSPYFDYDVSRTRFQAAKGAFGDGVKNYRLIPFRTIAVDPTVIPYGTVLYIPKARGQVVTMPDGTTAIHDGYFFAGDTGGLIKENHIDVFIGVAKSNPFSWISSSQDQTFSAYIVDKADIKTHLDAKHHGAK